jgi:hypothetical protein
LRWASHCAAVTVDAPNFDNTARLFFACGTIFLVLSALIRSWATALKSGVVHDSAIHSHLLVADGPTAASATRSIWGTFCRLSESASWQVASDLRDERAYCSHKAKATTATSRRSRVSVHLSLRAFQAAGRSRTGGKEFLGRCFLDFCRRNGSLHRDSPVQSFPDCSGDRFPALFSAELPAYGPDSLSQELVTPPGIEPGLPV